MEIRTKDKNIYIREPRDIAKIFSEILKNESIIDREKEHQWTVGLDIRNRIKYIELVSLGTLDLSLVHPRETFRMAIIRGVAKIILVHNHPSGVVEPSEEDIEIKLRLKKSGEILGIKLVDSLIVNEDGDYYSFLGNGLI